MGVDANLKLKISTALDNAGIKATEDQINGLTNTIKKANEESKMDKISNEIGKLPGPLGKVSKIIGGIPGQLAMVVGAFQTGYEIGTKFFDTVVRGWFGWEDAVTKLKKAHRALNKELENNATKFDSVTQRNLALHDFEIAKINNKISLLRTEAQTYTRLSKAASDFNNAGADQDIQQLERERFEDMLALQAAGEYEAAEQANNLYDIWRKQLEAKKEIASFDEESMRLVKEQVAKEQEAYKFLDKVDKLKSQKTYWEDRLKYIDESDSFKLAAKDYDRLVKPIQAKIDALDKQLDQSEQQAEMYLGGLEEGEIRLLARERSRSTLMDKLNLDQDKQMLAYGNWIDQNGNKLGLDFTDEYIKNQYDNSMKSYEELQQIRDNTQSLADKMDELLSIKK